MSLWRIVTLDVLVPLLIVPFVASVQEGPAVTALVAGGGAGSWFPQGGRERVLVRAAGQRQPGGGESGRQDPHGPRPPGFPHIQRSKPGPLRCRETRGSNYVIKEQEMMNNLIWGEKPPLIESLRPQA